MKNHWIFLFAGVWGHLQSQVSIQAESQNFNAVHGISTEAYGVYGFSTETYGIRGQSSQNSGVSGFSAEHPGTRGNSTSSYGVFGESSSSHGVNGSSISSYGVVGFSYQGMGARFTGQGGVAIDLGGANSAWGDGSDDCVIRTSAGATGDMIHVTHDNFVIHLDDDNNSTSGFTIFNGANQIIFALDESGNFLNGAAINGSSDMNRKEKIIPVTSSDILEKVSNLPISEWQFREENIRHIGPMAQDFYAAFGLGQGETTIATVDADGVALAAIQALKKENDLLKEQIIQLQIQMKDLADVVYQHKQ